MEPACVQTCLVGARIFRYLHEPASEVAEYMKKGAIRLESEAVKIVPNGRYYGNKRDLILLAETSAPRTMPQAPLRRVFLARLFKPVLKRTKQDSPMDLFG